LSLHAAGGVLVQCMPGGEEAAIIREAQHRMRTGAVYDALRAGPAVDDAMALARSVLGDVEATQIDTRPVQFRCHCSSERVADMLALLGVDELGAMIREDRPAEVFCNFCNQRYEVARAELERLRRDLERRPHGDS